MKLLIFRRGSRSWDPPPPRRTLESAAAAGGLDRPRCRLSRSPRRSRLSLWLESSLWPQQPIDGGSPTQKWPQCNCCAPCRGVGPHPSKLSFDLIKSFTFVFERSFSFAQATPSSFCSEQRVDKKVTTKRS